MTPILLDGPMHFIGAKSCKFSRAHLVGPYVVSTVGDYQPQGDGWSIPIGWNRFYETMVFRSTGPCTDPECTCGGKPVLDYDELDMRGYTTREEAERGHAEMVEKWLVRVEDVSA